MELYIWFLLIIDIGDTSIHNYIIIGIIIWKKQYN